MKLYVEIDETVTSPPETVVRFNETRVPLLA